MGGTCFFGLTGGVLSPNNPGNQFLGIFWVIFWVFLVESFGIFLDGVERGEGFFFIF